MPTATGELNACDFAHKLCPTCEAQARLREEDAAKAAMTLVEPGDARAEGAANGE